MPNSIQPDLRPSDAPILPRLRTPADLKALPIGQLPQVAAEIREAICSQVQRTGGHLAPNLGVVELTIALHYVFDFGHDRLLFDVGHQCYPHKLLTGRYGRFDTLRQTGGLAGFPDPSESPYDLFQVGHAGTSISTAVGMAKGDQLAGEGYDPERRPDGRRVVSLIGDASIANGVAMEGLNAAGTLGRQFLVVLNDNGMSISRPQGALARTLDDLRVSPEYLGVKRRAHEIAGRIPGGDLFEGLYHRFTDAVKDMVAENSWFAHFGLVTVGPTDGHDLPRLVRILREVAIADRPVLLHVHTIKGKGFEFAEGDATRFHSPAPFRLIGDRVEIPKKGRSFTAAFSDALRDVMRRDDDVVAATSAMPDGTGLTPLFDEFPLRAFDTGICESHAMDAMAGMAKTGRKPFFAVYSTFLQRAFDQAFQEVALQGLAVRLCLDRAGLVGGDGAVHHGFCDVSLLRVFPKAVLLAAMDEPSLRAALEFMRTYESGLSAVRYPRDTVSTEFADAACPPFELGRARALRMPDDGPDVAVLAYGTSVFDAVRAAETIGDDIAVAVYDARFAKPVDIHLLAHLLGARIPVVTVEDHGLPGGFGSCVLEAAADAGLDTRLVTRLGIPERWIAHGGREEQKAEAGIDAGAIVRAVHRAAAGVAVG